MAWTAETNLQVAHALHRVAWTNDDPRVARYVDRDRKLRESARAPEAVRPERGRASLADALTAETRVRWDTAWFDQRWSGGEEEAMATAAERIVAEAEPIPHGGLLSASWGLVCSPVVAGFAVACPRVRRVGIGPRGHGLLATLAAVSANLGARLPLNDLEDPDARRHLRLHVAATALLRATGDDEALTPWLAHGVEALAPKPAQRGAYETMIRQLAERCLDQPPGEVERIVEGLVKGRAQRLHRAWRRGFFVPPAFDLGRWITETTG